MTIEEFPVINPYSEVTIQFIDYHMILPRLLLSPRGLCAVYPNPLRSETGQERPVITFQNFARS
jgi:hypothetical protein